MSFVNSTFPSLLNKLDVRLKLQLCCYCIIIPSLQGTQIQIINAKV